MEDDTILSERIHFFTYPKDLELIETEINPNINFKDGTMAMAEAPSSTSPTLPRKAVSVSPIICSITRLIRIG